LRSAATKLLVSFAAAEPFFPSSCPHVTVTGHEREVEVCRKVVRERGAPHRHTRTRTQDEQYLGGGYVVHAGLRVAAAVAAVGLGLRLLLRRQRHVARRRALRDHRRALHPQRAAQRHLALEPQHPPLALHLPRVLLVRGRDRVGREHRGLEQGLREGVGAHLVDAHAEGKGRAALDASQQRLAQVFAAAAAAGTRQAAREEGLGIGSSGAVLVVDADDVRLAPRDRVT